VNSWGEQVSIAGGEAHGVGPERCVYRCACGGKKV
jgi:hypothetical protein